MTIPPRTCAALASLSVAPVLLAAVPPSLSEDWRHERRTEAEAAARPLPWPAERSPAALVRAGAFTSIQVNVDADGRNVVGDAANEPSIAFDPLAPNRLVVGWRQFDSIESSFRQAGYAWSDDGGRTWSEVGRIEAGLFRSDPVLEVDALGRFHYLSLRVTDQNEFSCQVFVSADGGRTWPTKVEAFGGDKAWIVLDRTGGPGDGNGYQAWNTAGNPFFPRQFSRSVGSGEAWEEPVEYDPLTGRRPVFGVLDVGHDGEVYVAGVPNQAVTGTFWVVRSSDAPDPSDPPTFDSIATVDLRGDYTRVGGPNPAGLLTQVEIEVDRSGGPFDGAVYVMSGVIPDGIPGDPMDIHVVRSDDGGVTWNEAVRVNDDPLLGSQAWQWMATLDVAPNGRLDAVWVDQRGTASQNLGALYHASSTDGGQTWSDNVPLGPVWDSFVGWPQQNKIGDYFDLKSDLVGAHLIYAATYNGEQDVYYLRIGDYDCDGNGIGDAEDLAAGALLDCDGDGIPDACEIAAGAEADDDGDGIPDACAIECADADLDDDGLVGFEDLIVLLGAWGGCDGAACPADLSGDGTVGFPDLVLLLAEWGACP